MATVLKLPEEVLFMIFEKLPYADLLQVQKVCRAWYIPGHTTLLEYLELLSDDDNERFIASIDENPNPLYLKAVKRLYFEAYPWRTPRNYDIETIKKLLFRFSNLRTVEINNFEGMCEEFSDELCEELLRCCPKLQEFEYWIFDDDKSEQFYATLWKLRHLITSLEVQMIEPAILQQGDAVEYLTSFPRLKKIEGYSNTVGSFQMLLRMLDKLEQLTEITITCESDDEAYFAERYFKTKSRAEQDTIVERLSNVKELIWTSDNGFGVHSAKFITEYLTGLESFYLFSHSNLRWTDSHTSILCDSIVDMVLSTKKKSRASIRDLKITVLRRFLPTVMDKMFGNSTINKILRIRVADDLGENLVGLYLEQNQYHEISLSVSNEKSLDEIMPYLFTPNIPTLKDIDEFELYISKKELIHYARSADAEMYNKLLERMPSLKKVTLDVPESFNGSESIQFSNVQEYTRVEELVIRATKNATYKQLLDRCFYSFPTLKKLDLQYYCCPWDEDTKEFPIKLANYSLENLKIDLTPVKAKMTQLMDTELSMEEDFFVIDVDILNGKGRYLYKVTFDLSSITLIENNHLRGYKRGKDYLQVHLIINNVRNIDVCLSKRRLFDDFAPTYLYDIEYKNIFSDEWS